MEEDNSLENDNLQNTSSPDPEKQQDNQIEHHKKHGENEHRTDCEDNQSIYPEDNHYDIEESRPRKRSRSQSYEYDQPRETQHRISRRDQFDMGQSDRSKTSQKDRNFAVHQRRRSCSPTRYYEEEEYDEDHYD